MVTFQHNMKRENTGSWGNSSFIWICHGGIYKTLFGLAPTPSPLPSCHDPPRLQLSEHRELQTFSRHHILFSPQALSHDFLSHITNSHVLRTKHQTALIWTGHSYFLFMLLLFCEYIPSCNYIFMSPKYKPHERRKLICFAHYSVLRT